MTPSREEIARMIDVSCVRAESAEPEMARAVDRARSGGAAALAALGSGLWRDLGPLEDVHEIESISAPDPDASAFYARLLPLFARVTAQQGELAETR